MHTVLNTRVLVVDDEEIVRDSVREILLPNRRDTTRLDQAASALFDDDEPASAPEKVAKSSGIGLKIELSEAGSGMDALDQIRKAVDAHRPFAVILLDMRMPGWDGLETAKKIRAIDRAVEIVFVTAFSDHGIDQIVAEAGPNVGYHCKPFAPEEIRQITTKGVYDWNKLRNLERLIASMGRLRSERLAIETLLQNILQQVSDWVSTSTVLIARAEEPLKYTSLVGCGSLGDPHCAGRLLDQLRGRALPVEPFRFEGTSLRGVAEGNIIAIWHDELRINPEKIYLMRLFMEHASQVIENVHLQERILLAEKLSAVGRAIGTVAHDLRAPIGAIQSALDVARMERDDPGQVCEMLDLIDESAEDALAIVGDILDFTRRSSITKRSFRAEELLEHVRRKTKESVTKHGVDLKISCEPGLRLEGDVRKLERVLINLIVNSAETHASSPCAGATIIVSARPDGGMALISVADNGPGIPLRIRSTLFEPFVSHGKAHGTGLGLAIAKQIAEAHGGDLSFTTSDQGTTFFLRIPRPEDVSSPSSLR